MKRTRTYVKVYSFKDEQAKIGMPARARNQNEQQLRRSPVVKRTRIYVKVYSFKNEQARIGVPTRARNQKEEDGIVEGRGVRLRPKTR